MTRICDLLNTNDETISCTIRFLAVQYDFHYDSKGWELTTDTNITTLRRIAKEVLLGHMKKFCADCGCDTIPTVKMILVWHNQEIVFGRL